MALTIFLLALINADQGITTASPGDQAQLAPTKTPGEVATGTPSDANTTVSAGTVADAVTRPDDIGQTGAAASTYDLSLGTSIISGDFGSGQNSRILSTALGVRYAVSTLRFSASLPYASVRSRGLIFSGIDGTAVVASAPRVGAPVTSNGIGDLTLGAAYTAPATGALPEIELSGRLKLPTATSSSRLSTGKTDFSVGLQISKSFGLVAPFVSVSYRVLGEPAYIHLRNGFALSAGGSIAVSQRTVLLLSYHYAQAATLLVHDSHELFAGLSGKVPKSRLRVTGFVTAGLSSGAAAGSGGVSLSLNL